jgi:hypothetical protein
VQIKIPSYIMILGEQPFILFAFREGAANTLFLRII